MTIETIGTAPFEVGRNTFQTWYKIVGDIKASHVRPVVALHGGPGMSHHYMLPHKRLFEEAGTPVVFYDQIGNGESSHHREAPKSFWTPELFMDELDNLLKYLGIYDDFDLLGQSWGGMLAGGYASSRTPKGLKRLIIANSPASIELYEASTNVLLSKFPKDFVKKLRKHEADCTTDAQEYQDGMMKFYRKHVCNINPWPETLVASFAALEDNPTVYQTMFGPSEFNIIGTLKYWSIINELHKIPYPTLLLSSPFDTVQGSAILPYFLHIKKIKWVELQNSTHLAMYEEPDRYFAVISDFLSSTKG